MSSDNRQPFFTIVIPTRERSDTLLSTIRTALAQDYESFEVLVSDNASRDDTQRKVEAVADSRLRYINTGQRVSMSDNWEFALNHVRDGWVTVLGDDDGILPGALRTCSEIIRDTGVEAIRANGCSYVWPSLVGGRYGKLGISLRRGYELRRADHSLQKVLDGRASYVELPMLYNGGFISTSLIQRARSVTERFFLSMTPDVYSAIVFGFLVERYVLCHEPLAINGVSKHSGGTAFFGKVDRGGGINPATQFLAEPNLPFHADLPLMSDGNPVRSLQAVIYEAFLQAAPFHALKPVQTTHAKQLRIILEKSGAHQAEVEAWANLFATKHGLEVPRTSLASFRAVYRLVIGKATSLWRSIWVLNVRGSRSNPLFDVYDASAAAGVLKVIKPGFMKRTLARFFPAGERS